MQVEPVCHVFDTEGQQGRLTRNEFLDLSGHPLAAGLLAQALLSQPLCLLVQCRKRALQRHIKRRAIEDQRVLLLSEADHALREEAAHLFGIRRCVFGDLEMHRPEVVLVAHEIAPELAHAGQDGVRHQVQRSPTAHRAG